MQSIAKQFSLLSIVFLMATPLLAQVDKEASISMSSFCDKQEPPGFSETSAFVSFDRLVSFDSDDIYKVQENQHLSILIERDRDSKVQKLSITRTGDQNNQVIVDGKTISFVDNDRKLFAQIPFTGNLEELLATADLIGVWLPLAEFLEKTSCDDTLKSFEFGKVVGFLEEPELNHLYFESTAGSVQAWLDTSNELKKLLITSPLGNYQGQFELTLDWKGSANQLDASAFTPKIPEDYKKIVFLGDQILQDFEETDKGFLNDRVMVIPTNHHRRNYGPDSPYGTARRTSRRTSRRTARRTGAYYSNLPGGCVYGVYYGGYYHNCGGTYYQEVYQGGVTVYYVVIF